MPKLGYRTHMCFAKIFTDGVFLNGYKLIACDLDGTLLDDNLQISDVNKAAIKELSKKGVYFVPATGRALSEIPEIIENPYIRYIIYSNGAVVYDKDGGKSIMICMSKEASDFVLDVIGKYDCYFVAHMGGETFAEQMSLRMRDGYNVSSNVKVLVDKYANIGKDIEKRLRGMNGVESYSVFFKSENDKSRCKDELSRDNRLYVVDSYSCNIEIFCAGAGKDVSLVKLCEKLNIDLEDVITIGDSGNDISMTRIAGLGLAAENGCESIKAVADDVICSNNRHVVKCVLDKYF